MEVEYIPAHAGHDLSHNELRHLPLPESTKEEVATKLSLGVNTSRILNGKLLNAYMYMHMIVTKLLICTYVAMY